MRTAKKSGWLRFWVAWITPVVIVWIVLGTRIDFGSWPTSLGPSEPEANRALIGP